MKTHTHLFALCLSLFVAVAPPAWAGKGGADARAAAVPGPAAPAAAAAEPAAVAADAIAYRLPEPLDQLSPQARILVDAGFARDVAFIFPPNQFAFASNTIAIGPRTGGAYYESVVYVKVDGKDVPRLVWLSRSSGTWRVAPTRKGLTYDKGDLHYTQQTKLPPALVAHLWERLNIGLREGSLTPVEVVERIFAEEDEGPSPGLAA